VGFVEGIPALCKLHEVLLKGPANHGGESPVDIIHWDFWKSFILRFSPKMF